MAPGATVTVTDGFAYGMILIQGKGTMNGIKIETPALIRFDELTNDEFFVSEKAATAGVTITNVSDTEPVVILKHFAENKELTEIVSRIADHDC